MKNIIFGYLMLTLFTSFQCEKDSSDVIEPDVTPEILAQKKSAILNYIASFSCSNANGCSSIAFGDKPCGGPRGYLLYPNSVNVQTLTNMVNEYNELDRLHNKKTNAISDCAIVSPPQNVRCDGANGCISD